MAITNITTTFDISDLTGIYDTDYKIFGDDMVVSFTRTVSNSGGTVRHGGIRVFHRDNNDHWTIKGTLYGSSPVPSYSGIWPGDNFGSSVSIDGDRMVVGSSQEDGANIINDLGQQNYGSVYYYTRNSSGSWVFKSKFSANETDRLDHFGDTVMLEGTSLLVSAPGTSTSGDDNDGEGTVYIFSLSGTTWVQSEKFESGTRSYRESFGSSVAFSGDHLAIWEYTNADTPTNDSAKVTIYNKNSSGVWSKIHTIEDTSWDRSGPILTLDGGYLMVSFWTDFPRLFRFNSNTVSWNEITFIDLDSTVREYEAPILEKGKLITYINSTDVLDVWTENLSGDWVKSETSTEISNVSINMTGYYDGSYNKILGTYQYATDGNLYRDLYLIQPNVQSTLTVIHENEKIQSLDLNSGAEFGTSIDIDGDTMVVGAPEQGNGTVFIYTRQNGEWIQTDKIAAPDLGTISLTYGSIAVNSGCDFGHSVSISGDNLLVGAPRTRIRHSNTSADRGHAIYFKKENDSWVYQRSWSKGKEHYWGFDVHVLDDVAVICGSSNYSSAYTAEVVDLSDYSVQTLERQDGKLVRGDISLHENRMFVENDYFEKDETGDWAWKQSLGGSYSGTGATNYVDNSFSGNTCVIGINGGRDVGIYNYDGTDWVLDDIRLTSSETLSTDRFGASVSLVGDTLLVGAPDEDGVGTDSGAVYVFEKNSESEWVEKYKFVSENGESGEMFGESMFWDGTDLIIGAPKEDVPGSDSGAIYLFNYSDLVVFSANLITDPTIDQSYGWSRLAALETGQTDTDNSIAVLETGQTNIGNAITTLTGLLTTLQSEFDALQTKVQNFGRIRILTKYGNLYEQKEDGSWEDVHAPSLVFSNDTINYWKNSYWHWNKGWRYIPSTDPYGEL